MKLESKIKSGRRWFTVILIILGWVISFPVLKYGVQARVEETLNGRTFLTYYVAIAIISIVYVILKYNIRYIEFDDKQKEFFLIKENKLGFRKRLTFDYEAVSYSEYDIKAYSSIEIFHHGKRSSWVYRRDFADEVYSVILKKLKSISQTVQE